MAETPTDVKEKAVKHVEETDSNELEDLEIDPALDRAITRKFDLHIIPWLFGLWLLAFIVGFVASTKSYLISLMHIGMIPWRTKLGLLSRQRRDEILTSILLTG